MTVLLDTHALIWWLTADGRLSPLAREIIEDSRRVRYVSAVTAFEITTKVRIGKMDHARELAERFAEFCEMAALETLSLRSEHALFAGRMPGEHRDPFDRLLGAQSRIEGIPLLTNDAAFRSLDVETVW